ncbi:LLM class flavin-dependent oxidoreductase [Arcanobacterium phocae]|uniref:LLM class flavin-dependent oxidoreductase n=1 Tax=Arcanobacterium phocae TaxID=131112 RepID=UPI001C11AB3C|nr:LLM class flavin-dependent oxidoreductase [Arcanobacterium phocae]
MKRFGFLSFGHHSIDGKDGLDAGQVLRSSVELAQAADEIGVNGAYFRVHHFAPQGASPMPLMGAIVGATKRIEVGTGVIDMRYENPLQLAEEAAALDLLSEGRLALGVSRGSPEPARRGWEAFGYGANTENGADMARQKFELFMAAIRGYAFAEANSLDQQYPRMYQPGTPLPVFPHSPILERHVWWGSGTRASAEQAARDGVNLMSSTLVSEADGSTLGELQAEQIRVYRQSWEDARHDWDPRVSVSRSVFPIVSSEDRELFGLLASDKDQIGLLEGATKTTFGRTYAAEPDVLIEQLKADPAVESADTLMLTIPNQLGTDVNIRILDNFAKHVAPALGWKPNV